MESKVWTVLEILKWTENYFQQNKIDPPRLDAELLLSHLLGLTRLQLYLQYDRPLSDQERLDYKVMIKRRVNHEPVQYITGEAYFMGLCFKANNSVLIPRPETELLVEKAIDFIKGVNVTSVIDVGTGSGAIAVTIAHFIPDRKVLASEISNEALDVARENAKNLGVADRVEFRHGDLLEPWLSDLKPADNVLILANLPYVREREWAELTPEVKDYEPRAALVSGPEGTAHYERFIAQLGKAACPFTVLLEMGIAQTDPLTQLFRRAFSQVDLKIFKDLSGKERLLMIRQDR